MPIEPILIFKINEILIITIINLIFYILFVKYKEVSDKKFWINLMLIILLAFFIENFIIEKSTLLDKVKNLRIKSIYKPNSYWDILMGASSLIVTIYIYSIGIKESLKKNLINIVMRPEKMIFIICNIFFLRFLNIPFYYYLLLFLYLLYLLPQNLICLIRIEKNVKKYLEEEKIFENKINEKNCYELYRDLKSDILKNIISEDLVLFNENYSFLEKFIKRDYFFKFDKKSLENGEYENTIVVYLNQIYYQIKYIKNYSFFDTLNNVYFEVASIFYENNEEEIDDKKKFKSCILNFKFIYEYYLKIDDKTERKCFQRNMIDAIKYKFSNFDKLKISEKIEWFSAYLVGITETIRIIIINEDIETFRETLRAIRVTLKINFNDEKEVPYFSYSFYLGLELLIETLKDTISEEKYKEFLEECKKYELKSKFFFIEEFMEFYDFLINNQIKEKLEWDKFCVPKEEERLYEAISWMDSSSEKMNQLIAVKISKYPGVTEENFIKEKWELFSKKFVFRENLLELVEDKNKSKVEKLFEIIKKNNYIQERENKIKNKISPVKIDKIKNIISEELEKSIIIKYLKSINSYEENQNLEIRKTNYAIRTFLERDFFFEKDVIGNYQEIFKQYVRAHEQTMKMAIVKKIEKIRNVEVVRIEEIDKIEEIEELIMISSIKALRKLERKDKGVKNQYIKNNFDNLFMKSYQTPKTKLPIILLNYESDDIYLFDLKKIKFTHRTNILSEEKIGFCKIKIYEYKDFFNMWSEEKMLEFKFLEKIDKKEEKIEELKANVYFQLEQDFDIIIDEEAKLYRINLK